MFGIDILDVAIGLFFGYLVLSLAVTAANEMSAAWFKRRAWMLRKGILNLLDDDALTVAFYAHPLIQSLSQSAKGPSYIPSHTFAMALLDILEGRAGSAAEGGRRVDRVLALLSKEAGNDAHKFRAGVETWFNDGMERVSGWYKRRTQVLLLIWAAVVTVATNADTLVIAKTLWRDPALRQALVTRAEQYVAQQPRPGTVTSVAAAVDQAPPPPPLPPDQQAEIDFQDASARYNAALSDLAELQLPLGWDDPRAAAADEDVSLRLIRDEAVDDWPGAIWEPGAAARWLRAINQHAVGWLLTILAVSLGAPFWFDTLNRIISIRSSGKAPEEAQKPPRTVPTPREPGEEP